jgi:hypothetical protein
MLIEGSSPQTVAVRMNERSAAIAFFLGENE